MKKNNIIIATFLLSSLFSGCSKNDAVNENDVETSTSTIEQTTESETESFEDNTDETISEQTTKEEISSSETESNTVEESTDSVLETLEQSSENTQASAEVKTASTSALSNEKYGWYFNPNDEHIPPTASDKVDLAKYDAYYLGDTSRKVIYLTFDEGYENGYSSKILDVLKEKDVKAAFFVTKPFIESNKELIKRMVDEGHVVGNHSSKHKSCPDLTDEELKNELEETSNYFKEVTGQDMPKVFRPPMGEYSERTLAVTQSAGYKSIFWSFAYKDWLTDAQPGKQVAYDTVMKRYHNGAIMLLHAVSQSNTEALGDIIDSLKEQGYSFESLTDL